MAQSQSKDHWSSQAYNSAASFVPKLTSTVVSYLDARPGEHILDIGCGDGPLTAQIADSVGPSGHVLGLDASKSMIETAETKHGSNNCNFKVQDCRNISSNAEAVNQSWDKVFSNAALHWILRDPSTRHNVFRDVHRVLKPGGTFVFEMGGKGNIAEIHAAIISAMTNHGISPQQARDSAAWFFPSDVWMRKVLEEAGFEVRKCELEYRPTKLNPNSADGSGGLEGWVRLMGAQMLEAVGADKVDSVVKQVVETLETIITREEDGSQWIGYVRLRAVVAKKA
ncbi:hypothetical protein MBLNU457_7718t1 [Dothideomycetes sp. NU457]